MTLKGLHVLSIVVLTMVFPGGELSAHTGRALLLPFAEKHSRAWGGNPSASLSPVQEFDIPEADGIEQEREWDMEEDYREMG